MDPHTARCLQLSTSINMPFNPYRPHRYSDSVNRSRFPVSAPDPQTRAISSSHIPSRTWSTPIIQNVVYQNTYTPSPQTPQSAFVHQKPHIASIQTVMPPTPMDLESPFSQACFTPYDRLTQTPITPWTAGIAHTPTTGKLKRSSGLGLNFVDQDNDLTSNTLNGTGTESFEDLVRLDEIESWDFNPVSPDRRSWSSISVSSGEAAAEQPEIPEQWEMPALDLHMSSGLGMSFKADSPISKRPDSSVRPSGRSPHHHHRNSTHSYRTTPYAVTRTRSSSASTASLSMPKTQCCSPLEPCHETFELNDTDFQMSDLTSSHGAIFDASTSDIDFYFPAEQQMTRKPQYSSDNMFMPAPYPDYHVAPPVLPSSGFFQSGNEHPSESLREHYHHDLADEPDLFGPLSEEQVPPPEEDMKTEDPELEPRSQELRFDGDLYTPKYVRGHGNKREGWCGICKPGRWLVLKNSAFWYDKSFTHGISAATGLPFEGPKETRRMSGNPDVWEGLCGSCGDWIALISSKKKGTTWFRHAYKCHIHQKAKDTPKRRREPAQNKVTKAYKAKKPKQEIRGETPESLSSQMDPESPSRKGPIVQTISTAL
ncbi:hypothetical protein MMC13_006934 [Lambiella insularis]|nr:hypothetical protein [Lambiella insularis]